MNFDRTLVKTIDGPCDLAIGEKPVHIQNGTHADIYQDNLLRGVFYVAISSKTGNKDITFSATEIQAIESTNEELLYLCLDNVKDDLQAAGKEGFR